MSLTERHSRLRALVSLIQSFMPALPPPASLGASSTHKPSVQWSASVPNGSPSVGRLLSSSLLVVQVFTSLVSSGAPPSVAQQLSSVMRRDPPRGPGARCSTVLPPERRGRSRVEPGVY